MRVHLFWCYVLCSRLRLASSVFIFILIFVSSSLNMIRLYFKFSSISASTGTSLAYMSSFNLTYKIFHYRKFRLIDSNYSVCLFYYFIYSITMENSACNSRNASFIILFLSWTLRILCCSWCVILYFIKSLIKINEITIRATKHFRTISHRFRYSLLVSSTAPQVHYL